MEDILDLYAESDDPAWLNMAEPEISAFFSPGWLRTASLQQTIRFQLWKVPGQNGAIDII
jgi:hypothetical protein